jgi:hypothetical protein
MTAMSTWDTAPTLLLWSQNVEPPVLVRLECRGPYEVLEMLGIWISVLVPEAGLIKAALPPPLLVAAQPPSLRSYGRKMSNLRFSSGSNVGDPMRCSRC